MDSALDFPAEHAGHLAATGMAVAAHMPMIGLEFAKLLRKIGEAIMTDTLNIVIQEQGPLKVQTSSALFGSSRLCILLLGMGSCENSKSRSFQHPQRYISQSMDS